MSDQKSQDQLRPFVKVYKAAYEQAGGGKGQTLNEGQILQKLQARNVANEEEAKQAGTQDGQSASQK